MPTISKLLRASSNGTSVTGTGNTTVLAAPGAGLHYEVRYVTATNSGTATIVAWRDGAAGALLFPVFLNANTTVWGRDVLPVWKLSSNTALVLNQSATGTIDYHVDYEIVPD